MVKKKIVQGWKTAQKKTPFQPSALAKNFYFGASLLQGQPMSSFDILMHDSNKIIQWFSAFLSV